MSQQDDNTSTQNDQQRSRYYNSYPTSNFPQQPQDHQNQQSREQQAGHSDQQASWYFDSYASYNNYHDPNYEQPQPQLHPQPNPQPTAQSDERVPWYFDATRSSSYQVCRQAQQQQQQLQQQQRSDLYPYYHHNDYANNNYNVSQNQDRAWYSQQQTMENAITGISFTTTRPPPAVATPIPTMTYPVSTNNNENKKEKQHDRSPVQPMETEVNPIETNNITESNQHRSAAPALLKDTEMMMLIHENENSVASISDDESEDDYNNINKYEMEESEYNEDEDEDEDDWMNHDSDSVASYTTANEEPIGFVEDDEDDEDNENKATLLSDIHCGNEEIEWKIGEHFMNLINEFGEDPGMRHMEGPLEHHDIDLPRSTNVFFKKSGAINWTIELVKKFSKVDISIDTYGKPYIMKLTGTSRQCYYAIKAVDAILFDHVRSKSVYVLLRLDGPRFKEQAKNIGNVLSKLVPDEQWITEVEELHVTVARPDVKTDADYDRLINVIKEAGKELKEAFNEDHFIGRFNNVYHVTSTYLGASPIRKDTDSIGVIRTVIQEKLKAAKLIDKVYDVGQKMHMTLYSLKDGGRRDARGASCLTREKLEDELAAQGIELDYGPMVVRRVEVSRRAISLASSLRYLCDFVYNV